VAPTSNTRNTNVAAWTALLLLVLGSVLVGLFIAGRLLLSLDGDQDVEAVNAARREHAASGQARQHVPASVSLHTD
jgi:hypothetical protein